MQVLDKINGLCNGIVGVVQEAGSHTQRKVKVHKASSLWP